MEEKDDIMFPQVSWKNMLEYIKISWEWGSPDCSWDDRKFLENLWVFDLICTSELTDIGKKLFEEVYIYSRGWDIEILQSLFLNFPLTDVLQQYFWGVSKVSIEQIISVLKMTGYWYYDWNTPLIHFLNILNKVGIIKYQKSKREITFLLSPNTDSVPKNVFIDPSRPYSNTLWLKRILWECETSIYWLDKHFQSQWLEWLWSTADSNKIKKIYILSLDLWDWNLSKSTRKEYRRFKKELDNKGIEATWSTIDSKEIRDTHDRWIIWGNGYLRNVPNINAISSGQRSEMSISENYDEALKAFNNYWKKAIEVL